MDQTRLLVVCLIGLSLPGILSARTPPDIQKGETVLPADKAPSDAPIRRHEKAPWFQLSNLRKLTDQSLFGELVVDYKRETAGSMGYEVVMVVRGPTGRGEYSVWGALHNTVNEGTLRGPSLRSTTMDFSDRVEVWLEFHPYINGKKTRQKVSNSVTLGTVGQLTFAREWTDAEAQGFAQWEKMTTAPAAPPRSHVAVVAATPLLPGMPVLAGWMGDWKPAEVIDVRKDGAVLVQYRETSSSLMVRARNWLAIEQKTLDAAKADPSQFAPSVLVLPNGTTPLTSDMQAVAPETPLVKGAPLRAERGGQWSVVTVLEILPANRVRIHWDDVPAGRTEEDRDRSSLAISKETLAQLSQPGAPEQFAERAKNLPRTTKTSRHLKNYPITIAIPDTATRVTAQTPLEEGTKLRCCWAGRWHDVTALAVHDDGSVRIRWDTYGSAWDHEIGRECLIIDKERLNELQARAASKKKDATPATAATGDKFRVVLTGFGQSKIAVTKVVADITELDLKDAKEFVENPPVTLKQGLSKVAATKLQQQLEAAGGLAKIEAH